MPSVISSVSFTTTFNLTTNPPKFTFLDTTDYATPAIPTSGVLGVFKIVSPSGITVYNNTTYADPGSDIVRVTSATNVITIPLPNLSNQSPEQGEYIITYTARINDGVNPVYYVSQENTYDFQYASPTVSIVAQADCISPLITGQDTTDYIVGGITPTMVRTMTLDYPSGSGATPITNTTSATITTAVVYTGTQTFTVTSDLTYTFADALIVIDEISGAKGILVDCQLVCEIYCCLKSLNTQKENARNTNPTEFARLEAILEQVMVLFNMLMLAIDCGKQVDANAYLNKIKEIANCTDDCDCNDGTPRLVNGLGTQNVNVVVQSGGAPITVTSAVAGGITTYTVTFSAALVTKINASYNTVVVALNGTVTVTASGIINDVQTYTISANYPSSQNRLEFECKLEFSNYAVPVVAITEGDYLFSGSNIVGTANVTATDIANPNWATMNNLFTVDTFQTAANDNYKVTTSVVVLGADYTLAGGFGVWTAAQMKSLANQLEVQLIEKTSGSFKFRLVVGADAYNGWPVTNKLMVVYPDIRVIIKISE